MKTLNLTKVVGALLAIGAAFSTSWTAPWYTLVFAGLVIVLGVGLVVWAEHYELTHPELFPKTPKKEEEDGGD